MATNPIDLTTVANVNAWQGQGATVDAAVIQSAITNYSQNVLTRTGRAFLSGFRSYTERYNGNGSEVMQVRNYPVLAVTSLVIDGQTIPQSPDYIQPGWVIDTSGSDCSLALVAGQPLYASRWPLESGYPPSCAAYRFWEGRQNVAITYTAGYLLNAVAESHTVPSSPGPYTVTATNAVSWYADSGATDQNGNSLAGQYSVVAGVYTFNASLAGTTVLLNYSYGGTPYDLQQAATQLVAQMYKRRQWIDQTQVNQPNVGTTSYSKLEMELATACVIERYTSRFLT